MSQRKKRCVDCVAEGVTTTRKLATTRSGSLVPGPRCATHHRAKKRKVSSGAWGARMLATYGITVDEYWRIYEFQGRTCYICRRATGQGRKRLSVDHCHVTGTVRGLLCGPCNRDVVGHLRDDPSALRRAAEYLEHPPAVSVLGNRIAPIEAGKERV